MPRPASAPAIATEALVDVAVRILGDYGLADLSMRRVAKELGVQPSALYWHVTDKQSLLALVADRLLRSAPAPALTGDVRADVRSRAVQLHRMLLGVRDGAELVASVVALGTGGWRLRSLVGEAVTGAGDPWGPNDDGSLALTGEQAVLVDAVVALLLGSALVDQQRRQAEHLGVTVPDGTRDELVSGFPAMLELLLRQADEV